MLGWVVLGKTSRSLPGPRGYNSVNYHLIYYGKRGNLWHGECMRSTECLLVISVAIWGPGGGGGGGFNNQTGPILVHIYPLFNNNLHDKYRSNLIRTF